MNPLHKYYNLLNQLKNSPLIRKDKLVEMEKFYDMAYKQMESITEFTRLGEYEYWREVVYLLANAISIIKEKNK